MQQIKNILFDLGGVILNVDYNKTIAAFRELGAKNIEQVYGKHQQDEALDAFEIGAISSEEFRAAFRAKLNLTIDDAVFDSAWNAMLQDLPRERLVFLQALRKNYRLFLFSNNNAIHLAEISNICQRQHGITTLSDFFEKEYYSHLFGQRKPHPSAFLALLNEQQLVLEETLFIDDSLHHVQGAQEAGLPAVHLAEGQTIFDLGLRV